MKAILYYFLAFIIIYFSILLIYVVHLGLLFYYEGINKFVLIDIIYKPLAPSVKAFVIIILTGIINNKVKSWGDDKKSK